MQQGAETAVAALIVFLAMRLLVRWRHGAFATLDDADGEHRHRVRTGPGAFGIGLVHGMGGSAGVGVLLLAAIPSETLAVVSLLVLALFTAVSMTIVTTGFGAALGSRPVSGSPRRRVAGARHHEPRVRRLVRRRRVEPRSVPVLASTRLGSACGGAASR